jgi:hypothetical protein
MDTSFFHPPTRTEFSDEGYAAIGRALTFATRFEANCRALAITLDLKRAMVDPNRAFSLDDETALRELVETIHSRNLNNHVQALTSRLKLSTDIDKLLHDARKARNMIAHELTLGADDEIETDRGRGLLLEMMEDGVRTIAQADVVVSALVALVTHEPMMTAHGMNGYADRVVEWVCTVYV